MLNTPLEQLAFIIEQAREFDDQKTELLALMWLGRGDFDAAEWPDALVQASETRNARATDYLIGTPMLADYLEEALAALGYSLDDYEKGRL